MNLIVSFKTIIIFVESVFIIYIFKMTKNEIIIIHYFALRKCKRL